MDQLLYLLLGWLLGLLSPSIAEWIRQKHRQAQLIESVMGELHEIQYTMGFVAYLLRAHLGLVTDEFLDWFEPIVRRYDGPDADPGLAGAIAKIRREMSEEQRRQMHLAARTPNTFPDLKEYGIPFLLALGGEISICPLDFQRNVSRIKRRLDTFNQSVLFLRSQYEKTFDQSLRGDTRQGIQLNLEQGYQHLARQAQLIADGVAQLAAAWRNRRSVSA